MDKISKRILLELQINADQKTSQLAKKLGLPRTTVMNKIKKLESTGVIKGYKAIIDYKKLGYPVTALIHFRIDYRDPNQRRSALKALQRINQVEEMYAVTGRFDVIAKVRLKEIEDHNKLFYSGSGVRNQHILSTETMVITEYLKEHGVII